MTSYSAVGAAVSKVSGVIDIVQGTADQTPAEATEKAKQIAIERAIAGGAIEETMTIAEVDSLPVSYMANQLRTIVKAVGELDIGRLPSELEKKDEVLEQDHAEAEKASKVVAQEVLRVDPFEYIPHVKRDEKTGIPEWHVSATDIDWLALGCYVLGCAGGGSPGASRIQLRDLLSQGHTVRIIDDSSLSEDALVYCKHSSLVCSGKTRTLMWL